MHAAEDAFQATFLILARKAGSIRKRDSVASWLFGVARRVAVRADAQRKRSGGPRDAGSAMREAKAGSSDHPPEPIPEVQEEVDRLPERYRAPIVLCYLEGLTHEEAASRLRLPASTVRVRLMRARSRLRDRLIRRGLAPAVLAGLSASRAEAAIPAPLVDETIKAAIRVAVGRAAGVSAPVAALVEGVIRAMFLAKLKTAAALLAALMLASVLMISSLAGPPRPEQDPAVAKDRAAAPAAADKPKPKGEGPEVTVATVKRSRWERTTNQTGSDRRTVGRRLRQDLRLSEALTVDIGSRVKHGDVLAEVYDPELAVAVEKARAEVGRARARVEKAEAAMQVSQAAMGVETRQGPGRPAAWTRPRPRLKSRRGNSITCGTSPAKGAVAQEEVDDAADRYASAQAGIGHGSLPTGRRQGRRSRGTSEDRGGQGRRGRGHERSSASPSSGMHSAEIVEGYTKIIAPFDGIVTRRNYHVGDLRPLGQAQEMSNPSSRSFAGHHAGRGPRAGS